MQKIGADRVWMLLMCSVNDFEVSVRTAHPTETVGVIPDTIILSRVGTT